MVSKKAMKKNLLKLTGLEEFFNIRTFEEIDSDGVVTYNPDPNLKEVSIIPHNDGYLLIAKYFDVENIPKVYNKFSAGIDLGIKNLAAISTNN
jgi:transposase